MAHHSKAEEIDALSSFGQYVHKKAQRRLGDRDNSFPTLLGEAWDGWSNEVSTRKVRGWWVRSF